MRMTEKENSKSSYEYDDQYRYTDVDKRCSTTVVTVYSTRP